MIDPTAGISSLIATIPGTNKIRSSPLGQSGFGPAAIIEFGVKTFGNVPGYNALVNSSNNLTSILQAKLSSPNGPAPIYSRKQAEELNEIITAAAAALGAGDFAEAKQRTQELLGRDINSPTAYHLLGRIASAEGDSQAAIGHLQWASQLAPESARIAGDLFNARQLLRDDHEVLETASQLVKNRGSALTGSKLLFELAKRTPLQGQTYLQLAESFKTLDLPIQQLGALGVVLEEGTQDDLAVLESKIKQFITDNEPVGLAYSVLGRTQQKLGRFDEALTSLESAIDIAPEVRQYSEELANVHATLGNIALGKGELEVAEYRFQKAREFDPLNGDLKFGLAAVFVSQAKEKITFGLDNAARSLLGRATALLGTDEALDQELAVAYFRLGQRALDDNLNGLARVNFESALKHNPDLAGLKRNLADIYRTEGQDILDAESYADMSTKDFETVVDNFQDAFDLFSTRASYKTTLASNLNEFGLKLMNENTDYKRALEMFGRARELYPDNTTYKSNYEQALNLKITADNA